MDKHENKATIPSDSHFLQDVPGSQYEPDLQPKKKREGPRKYKLENSEPTTSKRTITSFDTGHTPLFEIKLMPSDDVIVSSNSVVKPSKHDVPFSISIYASNHTDRRSID